MRADTAGGGATATENARRSLLERARRARALAARYTGDAASVLIDIANDFDARAASMSSDAD